MKQYKVSMGILLGGLCLIVFSAVCWPLEGTYGCDTVYQVDISTRPSSGFLTANNMAPGDEVRSLLVVKNNGNLDFNYTVTSSLQSGLLDLYNKLLLTVSDSKGILYQGSFGGLKDFPVGSIAKGSYNNLIFSAKLPMDTGNELQGKSASVAFNFIATSHCDQIPMGCVCFEPPFSNNNFSLKQNSTVPIKFHLRNSSGKLETISRSQVRLEIAGPGINGGVVKYVFSISNGMLRFDRSIEEPHYLARFSTFDYPVKTGGSYKATVYDGSKVLCEKVFVVEEQGNRSNAQ